MSDDNELTFIRCPGCRSLVPAIANRCRMCGQLLTGKKDSSAPDAPPEKKSRIRQKTLSVDEEQISQAKEIFTNKQEMSFHEEEAKRGISPVSKFLQSERKEIVEISKDVDSEQPVASAPDKKANIYREPLRFGRSPVTTEGFVSAPPKKIEPFPDIVDEEENDDGENESISENESEQVIDFEEEGSTVGEVKRKRKRRRRKKKHGVNAPVSIDQTQPLQGFPANHSNAKANLVPEIEEFQSRKDKSDEGMGYSNFSKEKSVVKELEQQPSRIFIETKTKKEEEEKVMATSSENLDKISKVKYEGRLIGWLVSYRNDFRGAPIEIREGRFFIGGSKLRETDLVLGDESLSTPHCLAKAETKDGLVVQDLMSEKGSYVKKQGSSSYELITVPTAVSHGDWLKFGEYEVMACIVPAEARSKK